MKMTDCKSRVSNIFPSVKLHVIILFGFYLLRMVTYMIDS